MKQTPVHDGYNNDLLALIPIDASLVVEAGSSSGALAKAYKTLNPHCKYVGIEVDPEYVELSKRHCDTVLSADLNQLDDAVLSELNDVDCWIFGDVLEHLVDPWELLERVRPSLSESGCVTACIPNMQHWSIQLKLNSGALWYEDAGLLDKTHLRWFTRQTIIELFTSSGYRIVAGQSRTFESEDHQKMLEVVRNIAKLSGANPDQSVADASALQYVVKAVRA